MQDMPIQPLDGFSVIPQCMTSNDP